MTDFRITEPPIEELQTIEDEEAVEAMTRQFPAETAPAFDMGRDQVAPADATYGRPTVVGRVARAGSDGPVMRSEAKDILDGRGIRYEKLFYTARYWVAVVYS